MAHACRNNGKRIGRRLALSCEVDRKSCRRLALRVIDQAFHDLAGPASSPTNQASARDFLRGSTMLYHWCDVADVDPVTMIRAARSLARLHGSV